MYVYKAGPTYPMQKDTIWTVDADGNFTEFVSGISSEVNTWTRITSTFEVVSANYLRVAFVPWTDWAGTIYIDQVELTP
jgi:hypothetical protein